MCKTRWRLFGWVLFLLVFIWILSLTALAEEPYVLYVGGIQVTPENCDDVLGNGTVRYTETVQPERTTRTLYLDNALVYGTSMIDGERRFAAAIYSDAPDLNIVVDNESSVLVNSVDEVVDEWYGIYCEGNLHMSGGTLNILLNAINSKLGGAAICSKGNVSLYQFRLYAGCGEVEKEDLMVVTYGVNCQGILSVISSVLVAYTADIPLPFCTAITAGELSISYSAIQACSSGSALLFSRLGFAVYSLRDDNWLASVNYDGSDPEPFDPQRKLLYHYVSILPKDVKVD